MISPPILQIGANKNCTMIGRDIGYVNGMVTTYLIILGQGAPDDHREGTAPVEGVGVGNVLVEGGGGGCPVLTTKPCLLPGIECIC